jgi:Holliday junction resolvase RusA-like endonuclease
MTFTIKDLEKLGYSLQPDGSYSHANTTPTMDQNTQTHPARVHHPKPQPTPPQTLDSHPKGQARGPIRPPASSCYPSKAKQAKAAGPQHKLVITRFAPRPLDIDNFAGGCKALIDCIKQEQLIPDDDPASVSIEFRQEKCKQKEQRTEIEIYRPDLEIAISYKGAIESL